jgi:hypothetical protein
VWFKVAVAIHHFAYGGTVYPNVGDYVLSSNTVKLYIYEVCRGKIVSLRAAFMRVPRPEEAVESHKRFAMRRGMPQT